MLIASEEKFLMQTETVLKAYWITLISARIILRKQDTAFEYSIIKLSRIEAENADVMVGWVGVGGVGLTDSFVSFED